ncbi:SprT-like family-domain-containing protein [Apodospora peruviana]|uniref:SprT-like family-domain-containing protein n=1 Tax=Apodospora peruviana TaxID=516989 RepID=A0AAE0ICB2_9PEZI|nr:SprT-like family-domain-containing protein [Apodospora peruviana]
MADDNDNNDDYDDEFPDVAVLVRQKKGQAGDEVAKRRMPKASQPAKTEKAAKAPAAASVRRRKLGQISDNALLRAWTPDGSTTAEREEVPCRDKHDSEQSRRLRVDLRTRKTRTAAVVAQPSAIQLDTEQDDNSEEQEQVTITEEVSVADDDDDDVFESCESEISDFEAGEEDDDDDDSITDFFAQWPRAGKKPQSKDKLCPAVEENGWTENTRRRAVRRPDPKESGRNHQSSTEQVLGPKRETSSAENDLADRFSRIRLGGIQLSGLDPEHPPPRKQKTTRTPPDSPPRPSKSQPGLVSPKKLPRIPSTPHHPNSDIFWSREFVDDWNDEHSPRKQLFPDAAKSTKSPAKPTSSSPRKTKKETGGAAKTPSSRQAKKNFETIKHEMAERFLKELDSVITDGQLSELAASTGGIKLNWTNKLNTTAGRANWKRETVRTTTTKPATGGAGAGATTTAAVVEVKHKHHASIELAEKVINDEHRLLNVMAHEFCHLANFMVSGVTTNPHGKQFKAWAAKCSHAFGASHGIEVTTKHSYDIDFRYVWECSSCGLEYKRHSKSINPDRHRCGGCKSELRQTKPVPRGNGGKGPSEYQKFMKSQMKLLKEENPGSPQKDIMRLVASRWEKQKGGSGSAGSSSSGKQTPENTVSLVDDVEERFGELTVGK